MTAPRKKLIEVSMPLEAINTAATSEKSVRQGHPSTLHLWWARRPLAACRAVLFAQLVDDPSAWPEEFPTEEHQTRERQRLHRIIANMVPWKASNDNHILNTARYEIARSLARSRGDDPPDRTKSQAVLSYLAENAPPICDPFCGGGSIPLEAQRLGLRAHGSDLNPVAVLISKATCEIPPKFAALPPVNPERDRNMSWKGAQGLAKDIRYYGRWMRNEAEARIGHLYPKVEVTRAMAADREDLAPYVGQELTVIAWLWARTVASPDPMLQATHIPLVTSFVLSSKRARRAIVVPITNGNRYRFTVKAGGISDPEFRTARQGTKAARGANFTCLISGAPIPGEYIKAEGRAGRLSERLMAIVVEGRRGRVYLDPSDDIEAVARKERPEWRPLATISGSTQYLGIQPYGVKTFDQLFTDRQLVALTTFSELVLKARKRVYRDALECDMLSTGPRLAEGGTDAEAYADAIATFLGLCVSRQANRSSNLNFWDPGDANVQQVFARQVLPMVWDYCEGNPFSSSSGNFLNQVEYLSKVVERTPRTNANAAVTQQDATGTTPLLSGAVIATDPPYYDNVPYADISDFFYIWLRRTLLGVHENLFRRLQTPKSEELVAFAYRHENKPAAEKYFMLGMARALRNMHESGNTEFPMSIFYAFKQSEVAKEGLTSPGWATFLQGLVDTGHVIDGTWPIRSELTGALKKNLNTLASSIVLACRKRKDSAPTVQRREFMARLRSTLPTALAKIRAGGVGPVDMAQAALGPGMGVFTSVAAVLEPDDTPMTVRTAIALINQVRDEISGEEATSYDPDTSFCIDWFETFGFDCGESGAAITMAQAYGIGIGDLQAAGAFSARGGRARLLKRDELPEDWDPAKDMRLTDWECAQHLARVLESPDGGLDAAARLYAKMDPSRSESARMLAYRLYDICERKKWATEAQTWNTLAQEWPALEAAAADIAAAPQPGNLELDLADGG